MDNRVDLPGYKYYRRPDGSRPEIYVAFADIVAHPASPPVNGICLPLERAVLRALDARERNYDRVDVTRLLEAEPPGRTWAYLGSVAGRARLARGLASGNAVVTRGYLAAVEAGFEALGADELAAFRHSSALDTLRVEDLERVDLWSPTPASPPSWP